MAEHQENLDKVFQALADPTRRAVIQRLSTGPASVSELAGPHNMAFQSFSQHLKMLEDCGLVQSAKSGRVRTCRIADTVLSEAEQWICDQRRQWSEQFDQLDDYLTELQSKEADHEE